MMRIRCWMAVGLLFGGLAACAEQPEPKKLMAEKEYFATLADNEAIVQRDSGLYFEPTEEGSGSSPAKGDQVRVHYKGMLTDGSTFDSSYKRGEPATFPVDAVIPGFAEGLKLMKEGGKAKLHIPPDIGYGERGAGPIPPNAVLIFEVELLEVL